jgi:hypothetical protein
MNLNIFQQTNPTTGSNVLVAAIYKASAPTVVVALYVFPGAYTGQTQLHTFTGLSNIVYHYTCFESPDGGADGTIRNSFDVQPNNNTFSTRDDLYLVADTSANFASNTNFYGPDSSLIGWNYGLERVAQGTLQYGVDYTKTVAGVPTTQDDVTADGWKLLKSGDVLGAGEKFVLHFLPQVSATSAPPSVGSLISQTTLLTSTTTLDNTALGQSFLLQGAGGYLQVNLPDLGTVSDNTPMFFVSAGGSHINAGLNAFGSQKFMWFGNQTLLTANTKRGIIYLAQCENVGIYSATISGTKYWIIFQGGDGLNAVGEVLMQYSKVPPNTIAATGALISRTNYARLFTYANENGLMITDSTWNNTDSNGNLINQGYYATGDGSTTFRLPLLTHYPTLRPVNPSLSRAAGSFQEEAIGLHDHEQQLYTAVNNGGRKPVGFSGTLNDLGGSGVFTLQNVNLDNENRTRNVGFYPLIRI